MLLFGLLCLATAATFLAGTYLSFCPDELVWAAFALGLVAVVVYISALRRSYTRFW